MEFNILNFRFEIVPCETFFRRIPVASEWTMNQNNPKEKNKTLRNETRHPPTVHISP